jgi:hypothetical protein
MDIRDPRLGLDNARAECARDQSVGGAEIARNRHRDLGSPTQGRMQAAVEAVEEREMGTITDRVPVRMQGGRELQAHHRCDPCREVQGQGARVALFRAGDSIGADNNLPRHLADTEPTGDPRTRQLIADALP